MFSRLYFHSAAKTTCFVHYFQHFVVISYSKEWWAAWAPQIAITINYWLHWAMTRTGKNKMCFLLSAPGWGIRVLAACD